MPQALQIKRGLKASLPAIAALGEPLIATDTRELFIGTGTSVYKVGDIIFSDTPPPVVPEKVWIETTTNTIYRASDDGLTWETVASGSGTVSADFTVYGVSQGIYNDGATIPAGTSLEDVVKNMLQRIIPPSYVAPTLSLSAGTSAEVGTSVTPTLTSGYNPHDGGTAILYTLKKDGADVYTDPAVFAFTDTPLILDVTPVLYNALITYNAGPVKNDNQGNPYPVGQILAGTANSGVASFSGYRRMFYDMDLVAAAPTLTTDIRSLGLSVNGPANGTAFTLNIPAGTRRIVFAYPATLRDVSTVKYVQLGNGEVKDTFTQTLVDVEGADGFTAISYKVYTYIAAVPFADAVTYQGVI